jgi:hypothetical protein
MEDAANVGDVDAGPLSLCASRTDIFFKGVLFSSWNVISL